MAPKIWGNAVPPAEGHIPDLQPDQFWFALKMSGYEEDLLSWIESFNDPEGENYEPHAWAFFSAKLDKATFFERHSPLVENARIALGMSEHELDSIWNYASTI